jgi:hypothetical protein
LGIIGRNSLESGGEAVGRFTGVPNGRKSISNGQTLPVAIRIRLLLFEVCDPANCLIYAHDPSSRVGVLSDTLKNRLKEAGTYLFRSVHYSHEAPVFDCERGSHFPERIGATAVR